MPSLTRLQLENWLKTIDVKADKVLDIGGAQNPVKGRTKSWNVKNYSILDLPNPHEKKAESTYYHDLNDIITSDKQISFGTFDIVFCLEVTEYLYDPDTAFFNIRNLLKYGGIVYVSSHLLYPVHNPAGLDYLRYTPDGIRFILNNNCFDIVEDVPRVLENVASHTALRDIYGLEKMRPRSDVDHTIVGNLIKAKKIRYDERG